MIENFMSADTLAKAKLEVYRVCQTGQPVTFHESLTSNDLGTTETSTAKTFKAHPIRISPFDRKIVQKAAWAESMNAMAFFAKHELDLNSFLLVDFLRFKYAIHDGTRYEVSNSQGWSAFGTDFLYVVVGLKLAS